MKKRVICALLALLMLLFCACSKTGEEIAYAVEHEHVFGFWYESAEGGRERYCKICFEVQTE